MLPLDSTLYVLCALAIAGVVAGLALYAWHHLNLRSNSERMRVEEALRSSEAQLRAIIDHSPSAIILFNTAGDILLWNTAAERLYGWTAAEVLGRPLPTVQGDQQAEKQAFQERVNRGEVITYTQVERRCKDGSVIQVGLSVAPLKDAAGQVYAQMSITTDITALKQAQADLLHREQALTALQERERIGRDLHDGLGQMLGYLNVQVQATQALLANGLTLAAQANLQQMAQVAQDTHANLRSHILGLRTPLPTQDGLLQALSALLQQFSVSSGIATTLSVPEDVAAAPFLPAVEEQILRIIQEALANVRKHANAHKVEVLFSFTREHAQVIIVDDGVGFEPAQVTAAGASHFGLSIMRERAEQIGGRLEVRSAPGQGTQIVLCVPRFMPDAAAPAHDDQAAMQRIRVLLVDDHPLFLDGMRNLLRARGITVVGVAQDGLEARVQARALHPDVIVMDVEMPRCDGVEATRLIKAEFPEIKVVMLTVSDAEEHLFAALRNGASGYLLKDLDANAFCQLLADAMRGEVPLPPGLAARVLAEFAQHPAPPQAHPPAPELTAQQSTILRMVAAGKLYKEVAAELNLSEKTIKYHMGQILDRLHVTTRAQAIAYARRSQPDS